ncbi:twin-arginine translocase subunit TatC, partial [Klebsiella pneumoniae]|nr:twin-arginine translocase subunit TatC [Klebsiella pneumoniae]
YWISEKNNVYAGIQILYQVTVHLEELRRRILYVVIAFAIGFGIAFAFKEVLLGLIIRPVRIMPAQAVNTVPVQNYVIAH